MNPVRRPSMGGSWRRLMRGVVLLVATMAGSLAVAQPRSVDEFALKAAFLYNFTRFVEWPPTAFERADSPFRICVIGRDPFGTALDALQGRTVGKRPIRIHRSAADDMLRRCHIAYLGEGAARVAPGTASTTLTVDGDANFVRSGALLGLVTRDGRVHLVADLPAIQASPLKFSAKLLEVAETRGQDRTTRR